jgi:hypothetical protein
VAVGTYDFWDDEEIGRADDAVAVLDVVQLDHLHHGRGRDRVHQMTAIVSHSVSRHVQEATVMALSQPLIQIRFDFWPSFSFKRVIFKKKSRT